MTRLVIDIHEDGDLLATKEAVAMMKVESTGPVLYPMGVYTFAFACVHCANRHSDKCHLCKCEKKSGFEPKKEENNEN